MIDNNKKYSIAVTTKINEKTNKVEVYISYPPNQDRISIRDSAHILASGISLMIKNCSSNELEIKDYELLDDIVHHLETEFASTEAFSDAYYNKRFYKTNIWQKLFGAFKNRR